jgi:hypothetical protein
MALNFQIFKKAITGQFAGMVKHDLFCTSVDKDAMWNHYLDSFPEGTNPIFRERREYDCSCCRNFIKRLGNVVAIVNGERVSIWDTDIAEPAFQAVARKMSEFVHAAPIEDPFLSPTQKIGTDKSHEDADGRVITWDHFYVELPVGRNTGKNYYMPGIQIGPALSDMRATHEVFLRGLKELTLDSLDTVIEITKQNSLYRGQEYLRNVEAFRKGKIQFDKLGAKDQELFAWVNYDKLPAAVSRIRNTAIGTLLIDLSEGTDLEDAVNKFEKIIMAPSNYKRPTSLVSKKMVADAQKKLEELNLLPALERRYAQLSDITINNIIFANRDVKSKLAGSVFDQIATSKPTTAKDFGKVETITMEKFLKDVVPGASSLEVLVENKHSANLVSLVAPKHRDAGSLFKWSNNFSWAYNGDVTDSVKERVKKAGGNVTGDLCCRLAWFNYDDLDFHMYEPGGYQIYFGNKGRRSNCGGMLDVDMNAGGGSTREPVENIFYSSKAGMKEGEYRLMVHQFRRRESDNVGFEVEFDFMGELQQFAYDKSVRQDEKILVARFRYSRAKGIEMLEGMKSSTAGRTIWGVKTQEFHPVTVLMHSPNYWDEQKGIGNKHYFFMLDSCVNDGQARPFFNEFLRADLDKYRKVIEIVGSKMKTELSDQQLSGLGFSETVRTEVLVRVKGNTARTLKVVV